MILSDIQHWSAHFKNITILQKGFQVMTSMKCYQIQNICGNILKGFDLLLLISLSHCCSLFGFRETFLFAFLLRPLKKWSGFLNIFLMLEIKFDNYNLMIISPKTTGWVSGSPGKATILFACYLQPPPTSFLKNIFTCCRMHRSLM